MRFAKQIVEGVILGAATWLGVRLGQALQDPTSDVRIRASELLDRLREVTR